MKNKIPAGMHVHTLIFDLGVDPEGWAKQHGFDCNPATPTKGKAGYQVLQQSALAFVRSSLKVIDLDAGVRAVVGTLRQAGSKAQTLGLDWQTAAANRDVVEMYCPLQVKGNDMANQTTDGQTPKPNPVDGTTVLKEDEPLWVAGIANANIVDRVEERLDPAGCVLVNYLNNPVFLANHRYMCEAAIGRVPVLEIKETGLHFEAWIGDPKKAPLTDVQRTVRSLVAQGILCTVSIGFIPLDIREPLFTEAGELAEPLTITRWELLEISVVPVPCNQGSLFALKSARLEIMRAMEENGKGFSPPAGGVTIPGSEATKQQPGQESGTMDELLKELVVSVKAIQEVCSRTAGMCEKMHAKVCEGETTDAGNGEGNPPPAGGEGNPPPPPEDDQGKALRDEIAALKLVVDGLAAQLTAHLAEFKELAKGTHQLAQAVQMMATEGTK
jgi:hypothetical protein